MSKPTPFTDFVWRLHADGKLCEAFEDNPDSVIPSNFSDKQKSALKSKNVKLINAEIDVEYQRVSMGPQGSHVLKTWP